jgi:hypothetical protein
MYYSGPPALQASQSPKPPQTPGPQAPRLFFMYERKLGEQSAKTAFVRHPILLDEKASLFLRLLLPKSNFDKRKDTSL